MRGKFMQEAVPEGTGAMAQSSVWMMRLLRKRVKKLQKVGRFSGKL